MITIEHIRQKLIEAIKNSGITQTELANKIGVCHQAIGQYLHQNKMPALDTFANLCAVLDVDANEILCVNEYTKPTPKRAEQTEQASRKKIIDLTKDRPSSEKALEFPAAARSKDNAVRGGVIVKMTREQLDELYQENGIEVEDKE